MPSTEKQSSFAYIFPFCLFLNPKKWAPLSQNNNHSSNNYLLSAYYALGIALRTRTSGKTEIQPSDMIGSRSHSWDVNEIPFFLRLISGLFSFRDAVHRHTNMHICAHIKMRPCSHTHMRIHSHTPWNVHIVTHALMLTHKHTQTHPAKYTPWCTHTHAHAHTAFEHTHVHIQYLYIYSHAPFHSLGRICSNC